MPALLNSTAAGSWLFRNIGSARDRMRARILFFFQAVFIAVMLGLVIPLSQRLEPAAREKLLYLAYSNLALTLGLFFFTRLGRVATVCWLQVLVMWLAPFYHMLVIGGLYSDAFLGWPMALVLAALLLGRAGTLIFGSLSLAGGLILTLLWLKGSMAPPVIQPPLMQLAVCSVSIMVLMAIQWLGGKQTEDLELRSNSLQARLDLFAEATIGEWKLHLSSGAVNWSTNMPKVLGRAGMKLDGTIIQLRALIFSDDLELFEQSIRKAQVPGEGSFYIEHRIVDAQGNICWVENRGRAFFNNMGAAVTLGAIITRIDERKRIEADLDRRDERLRLILKNSPVYISVLDQDGKFLFLNHIEEGYARELIIGKANMLEFLPPESQAVARAAMHQALASDTPIVYDLQGFGKAGTLEWYANRLVRFKEDGETHLLLMSSNISPRKEAETRLERLATRDSLTGLANRNSILELVDSLAKTETRFFLLFIDLDHFKTINDTLGHAVGDKLLVHIAAEIQESIGKQDYLARLGGDEFLALIPARDLESDTALRMRVESIATQIIAKTSLAHTIGISELFVSASIGIAFFPDDARATGELIKFADLAMYEAKQRGRARFAFFTRQLSTNIDERMRIDGLLRGAIEHKELSLHFQPLVDTVDGKVRAAEVLLRWNPKGQAPISPAVFIPIAEDTGLIRAIGDWVLHEACRTLVLWKKQFGKSPRLSINVSARQLERESFASGVEELLRNYGLNASDIELELTETSLLSNISATLPQLEQLAAAGIRLVIDDFGTGYSSLAYLKKLPVRALKIDRSFVEDIEKDKNDEAIIRAVMAMAKGLGLTVVAEGVERQVQLDFLTGLGCHTIQGYFYGKPVPADEFWSTWQADLGV